MPPSDSIIPHSRNCLFPDKKYEMLKFLLILAVAAAVATAAPSADLPVQDLVQDLDDDVEESFDSDLLDDVTETETPLFDGCWEQDKHINPCPLGQYKTTISPTVTECVQCPVDKPATAYGNGLVNCGSSSCQACAAGYEFDFNMCLNKPQEQQMVSWSHSKPEPTPAPTPAPSNRTAIQESDAEESDLEMDGCAITSCCLQGEYGTPPNCLKCPDSKPSSPRTANGAPDSSCKCPNEAASSCFACTSSCYPFVKSTGICTLRCPNCRASKTNQHNCPSNR